MALTAFGSDPSARIYVYEFESQQFQRVSALPQTRSNARWLSDSRRLLVSHQGRLDLLDAASGKVHEVLSVLPDVINGYSIARDDRLIVYGLRSNRADIWLASAEDRPTARQQ